MMCAEASTCINGNLIFSFECCTTGSWRCDIVTGPQSDRTCKLRKHQVQRTVTVAT